VGQITILQSKSYCPYVRSVWQMWDSSKRTTGGKITPRQSVRTRKNQLQILRIMDFQPLMGSRSDVPSLDQPKLEGLQGLDTPQTPGPPPRRTAPSVS
jgi:hypothetical protein